MTRAAMWSKWRGNLLLRSGSEAMSTVPQFPALDSRESSLTAIGMSINLTKLICFMLGE